MFSFDPHMKSNCSDEVSSLPSSSLTGDDISAAEGNMDLCTEQTYVAYLPEPTFCSSVNQHLNLYSLAADLNAADNGEAAGDVARGQDEVMLDVAEHAGHVLDQDAHQHEIEVAVNEVVAVTSHRPALIPSQSSIGPSRTSSTRRRRIMPFTRRLRSDSRSTQPASDLTTYTGHLGSYNTAGPTSLTQQPGPVLYDPVTWYMRTFDTMLRNAQDIHQDALALDHPCRFFDVLNFLEKSELARIYSQPPATVAPVVRDALYSLDQQRNVFREDITALSVDEQGLCWNDLGTTREQASFSRAAYHPYTTKKHYQTGEQLCLLPSENRSYRFRSFHARHRARFAHYQLRNVLCATSRSDIFYAAGKTVLATSLAAPERLSTVMDLTSASNNTRPFCVTSLAASPPSAGYASSNALIAGGYNGEYAVLNLNTEQSTLPSTGFITHAFDGLITHISSFKHRRSGVLQAAFCTNDRKVRIMDVPTLQFTSDFRYEHVMNASCMSSDGRLRVLVGDSCETYVTDAESGKPLVALSGHTNHAFACAWSPNGFEMATASQDGTTNVWDARYWTRPIASISSLRSCVRAVDFTGDGMLVMAENDDVVSLYDTTARTKQDLTFFGSVAGMALLNGGDEIVIANSDRTVGGLMIYQRGGDVFRDAEPEMGTFANRHMELNRRRTSRFSEAFNGVLI